MTKNKQIRNPTFNFGLEHLATRGVTRLVSEMDGEVVEHAKLHIGLLQRVTKKLIEYKMYLQDLPHYNHLEGDHRVTNDFYLFQLQRQ
ncbi:hypothetical protein SUGI_0394800 [Cryptomeria japonica]|nr:hypothetical protein SUGI_0394800 [Cryptomeria japonica]